MSDSHRARNADAGDGFRPDLEGLRAVAVVLVLLYHARVPGFGGGYVGVDVFFVLSGFLITGLLLRELGRSGTISLPNFYARRARRLLPAALLVLFVTIVASVIMLPPLRVPDIGGDTAAASLYVSNMRFAFQATDYLQAELAPSPVLHFWSLGVEEQFYVFWPAIVMLVGRGASGFGRRVGLTAVVISVVSLVLAIWLTTANGPWAFFSLPTRAWELGIGAVLAVSGSRLVAVPVRVAAVLGWAGLGMVALSGVILSVDTPFPGTAALLPTVGSALVIVAGFRPGRWTAARPLGTPVPRFLGRISYSLYLWHWPLLVLPEAALGHSLRWWERGALVGLAIVLAAMTQRWVENPLRHGRLIGTIPRRNLAMALALSVVVATVSAGFGTVATASLAGTTTASASADEAALDRILGGATASPAPSGHTVTPVPSGAPGSSSSPRSTARPTASAGPGSTGGPAATRGPGVTPTATADEPVPAGLRPSLADARSDLPDPYNDGCHVDALGTQSPACVYGNPGGSSTVIVFGDSHALSWWPAVDRLAIDNGWRFISLTKSACSSADVLQWNANLKRVYTECTQWRANTLARIASERPALVILTNSRSVSIVQPDGTPIEGAAALDAWQAGLERTVAAVAAIPGVKVTVIGDTPRSSFDVPVCLSQHRDSILACATPYAQAVSTGWLDAAATAARQGGATFVDPVPWVCPSRPCPPVIGNFLVFRDEHHLSRPFAAALASHLGEELPAIPAP